MRASAWLEAYGVLRCLILQLAPVYLEGVLLANL